MAKRPDAPAGATISIWTGSELVSFDGHTIYIQRTAVAKRGTDTYPVTQIAGVQIEPPTWANHLGRFRILVAGEIAPRGRQSASRAVRDRFVVVFGKKMLPQFEALANQIRQAQAGPHRPAAPVQPPAPVAQQAVVAPGIGDQLTKLAALHQSGALSPEEFAAAKAQLLGIQPAGPQDAVPRV